MNEPGNNPDFLTLMRAELNGALSQLEVRLIDRFASKKEHDADVELLNKRISEHERDTAVRFEGVGARIGSLEQSRAGALILSTWQRWFFGGLLASAVGALIYVAAAYIH